MGNVLDGQASPARGSFVACDIVDSNDPKKGVSVHNGGAGRAWYQSWRKAYLYRLRVNDDGSFVFSEDIFTNVSSASAYRLRHNMCASEGVSSSSSQFLVLSRKVELKRESGLRQNMVENEGSDSHMIMSRLVETVDGEEVELELEPS